MSSDHDIPQDKSIGELGREAFWFLTHTLVALAILAVVIGAMSLTQPDPDSTSPKILGSVLAFLAPMIGGFLIGRRQHDHVASYIWISGLVIFSVACVWVLDLPTGNGLCERCGAIEKLWRTFFDISNGSGLMAGDGLLFGAWMPLSTIGYAVGARVGLTA